MKLLIVALSLFLSGCSLVPNTQTSSPSVQVELAPDKLVFLPQPKELQKNVNVSQLITAQWGENNKQKLLVQLQVDQQQLVLAGFSAWGVKLLSLTYLGDEMGGKIETDVMVGLPDEVPKPEQVLFYLMLSIWPENAWKAPLSSIGWQLQEKGLQRWLIDENGQVVVIINYQTKPYLEGKITIKNKKLNYIVTVETKR